MDHRRLSKRLSFVLRHRPDSVGLTLDAAGWVGVEELLHALSGHGVPVTRAQLESVVAHNDKQRFAIDRATDRIRAVQGHSVPVRLGYPPVPPPPALFHGTPVHAVSAILAEGLRAQGRHDVHLSPDPVIAETVGARRGPSVVLRVDADAMAADGFVFRRADNGVWLTDHVPPRYLSVLPRD